MTCRLQHVSFVNKKDIYLENVLIIQEVFILMVRIFLDLFSMWCDYTLHTVGFIIPLIYHPWMFAMSIFFHLYSWDICNNTLVLTKCRDCSGIMLISSFSFVMKLFHIQYTLPSEPWMGDLVYWVDLETCNPSHFCQIHYNVTVYWLNVTIVNNEKRN